MEKRVILAFVLSFAVLYAFRALYSPPPPATETANATPSAESPAALPEQAVPPPPPSKAEAVPADTPAELKSATVEDVTFDTPLYVATFSNLGSVLKSFKLKRYPDGQGGPVELINQEVGSKIGWPLAFVTGDKSLDEQLKAAVFVIDRQSDRVGFQFLSKGIQARKVFVFDSENYQFTLDTSVMKDGKAVPYSLVWQGHFGDQSIPQEPARKNAVHQADASFKRVALPSLKDQPQEFTTLRAGVEDQYFLAMLSSDAPTVVKVSKTDYQAAQGKPTPTLVVTSAVHDSKPVRIYIGPKQRDWLSKADPQLASVLDYGYFEFIAKPLVYALLWLNSYIGNFGWAIVILTVVINLVLFPLRLKQQVSMLKMQKIQPHMRRLQDQYKKLKPTDPRRTQVQTEMMGLYKEHGVNPMGGCLPLLLQMPFLFAFYSALAYSIEMRRAPWILWVKDLSRPDYVFGWLPVLALLMTVSMFIQQKMTPTGNVDPVQAKMMLIMPLMFTVMFWSQSSGLVLYWLTGSVISILGQIFINKYWSPHAEAKLNARSRSNEPRGA
jgi:YidC/Oxa1 family membrane protein insertase